MQNESPVRASFDGPRCALAREPADDEIAGRMVRSPDFLYRGGAVIVHAVELHLIAGVIRVDEDVAGAEVGRPRVADGCEPITPAGGRDGTQGPGEGVMA